jgi:hypothetical protein
MGRALSQSVWESRRRLLTANRALLEAIDGDPNFARQMGEVLRAAQELGYATNDQLPLLDNTEVMRSVNEVVDRLLGMYCVAAAYYGFNRESAANWLNANVAGEALTPDERQFLLMGKRPVQEYKFQIEGIWALYWACGLASSEFSFGIQCPQDFATRLPDLKKNEDAVSIREKASLRDVVEVVQMADIAYCIHWAHKQATLGGKANRQA